MPRGGQRKGARHTGRRNRAPLLRDGSLVHVLADLPTPSADIHALYLATAHLPRRIRELVNHLAAGLSDRIEI